MTAADNGRVAVVDVGCARYPEAAPFNPDVAYPEYPFGATSADNPVYRSVREALELLGLDAGRYGTPAWNPLGDLVDPGDRVLVKPNLIWHSRKGASDEWQQVLTHGSVVRAIVDYVLIALQGTGEVVIADGPQLDAEWDMILERTGLSDVTAFYSEVTPVAVRLLDLRDSYMIVRGDVKYADVPLPGDPLGATVVDLGDASRLAELGDTRYYGADYNQDETNRHHSGGHHEYRICRTAMAFDAIVNVPKLKTHKKTGVTLALKNLVGVNSGRNWLPHYRDGSPETGGDQFEHATARTSAERTGVRLLQRLTDQHPRVVAPVFRLAKRIAAPLFGKTGESVRSGNWYGNDTCWRMVHDINRCVLYHDADGRRIDAPRQEFTVADGVIGGHRAGPEDPDPYPSALIVAGLSPVAADVVACRLMGFDPMAVPMLAEAFRPSEMPLVSFDYEDIEVVSNKAAWNRRLLNIAQDDCMSFEPHFGWEAALGARKSGAWDRSGDLTDGA